MKVHVVILVFVCFALFSCSQSKRNEGDGNTKNKDSIGVFDTTNKKLSEEDTLNKLIQNIDKIEIISFEKGLMESSLPDTLSCKSWKLEKNDFSSVVSKSKKVDFEDIHYLFETQACIYKGKFLFENKTYDFVINSGGWTHLKYYNITLGCFDNSCEKYFLGKVDKPEEEFKDKN